MKEGRSYPLTREVSIKGYKTLPIGTKLTVLRFNSRYVYCMLPDNNRIELRLSVKDFQKPKKEAVER